MGGQRAKIKNNSHDNLLKETELKGSSDWKHQKGKRQPAKESTTIEKGKTLTLGSNLAVVEGCDVGGDELLMNENQESQSQVHVTA